MRTVKLLLIYIIFLIPFYSPAQKWDKRESKIEELLEAGNYRKAERKARKLGKKAHKKLGKNNKFLPFVEMVKAENALQEGEWGTFETHVTNMLMLSETISGDTSMQYAQYLYHSAKLWSEAGFMQNAYDHLQLSKNLYLHTIPETMRTKMVILEGNILCEMGRYSEALQMVQHEYEFMHALGITKKKKKKEQANNFQQYAGFIVMAGKAMMGRGDINKADSLWKQHEKAFKKQLDKNDWARVNLTFMRAQVLENINNLKEAQKLYSVAYDLSAQKRRIEDKRITPYRKAEIDASFRLGYTKEAEKATKAYVEIAKKAFKRSSYHRLLANYMEAQSSFYEGKYKDAEKKLQTILDNKTSLPAIHPYQLMAYELLYEIQIKQNKYSDAFSSLEKQIDMTIFLYGNNGVRYHEKEMLRAAHLFDYTDEVKAIGEIIERSYEHFLQDELLPQHSRYVMFQNQLVQYYNTTDRYEKALKVLETALEATRTKPNNSSAYGHQLVKQADLLYLTGRLEESVLVLEAAEKILDPLKLRQENVSAYAEILFQKARMLSLKGNYDGAEKMLNNATRYLRRQKANKNNENIALSVLLAGVYQDMGQYSEAGHLLQNAIAVSEAKYGKQNRRTLNARLKRGQLKLQQGDYTGAGDLAIQVADKAEEIYGEGSLKYAAALLLKADISAALGDYPKAVSDTDKALHIFMDILGENHFEVAQIYARLAMTLFHEDNDNMHTNRYLHKALDITTIQLGSENPIYAQLLTYAAYLDIGAERYSQAFDNLTKAEKIWIANSGKKNNANAATINVLLGDVYYNMYDYRKARQHYQKSLKLYEKYFDDNHPDYVKVLAKTCRLEYMEGNEKKAIGLMETVMSHYDRYIQAFFPVLSEREKARFWNMIKEDYEFYNALILKSSKNYSDKAIGKLYDNALNTKALLLNTSIRLRQHILDSDDDDLIQDFNEWIYGKEILSGIISLSQQELDDRDINKDSLIQHIDKLERSLSLRSDLFGGLAGKKDISWQDVKSALKPHEVAVEMIRFRYFDHTFTDSIIYAALVLRNEKKQDMPEIIILADGSALEKRYFNNYRNSIIYRVEDELSYAKFWKPIEDKVGKIATIYFSPEGVYNQINLEAIPYPDGRYIMDNFNIILVGNTKDIYLRQFRPSPLPDGNNQVMLYGDPQFYVDASLDQSRHTISQLPGTHAEVEAISRLFETRGWDTKVFLTAAAQEGQVKKMANPKVFHIATHGFYEPPKTDNTFAYLEARTEDNPLLRSGLMLKGAGDIIAQTSHNYNFENGILTAYEAMNLNLNQTDLVVLSACETGLGDISIGEGVNGLQKAFLVAGAKVLIMSMFKVNDEVTRILMTNFYEHWLETGNIRRSFAEARNIVRDKYPEPIYWGAFVVFGLE